MEEILHQLIYIGSLSHYLGVFYIPGGSSGCLPLTVCQNTWCQLSQGTWFAKGPTSQRAHPGNQTLAKKFRWENLNWNVHFCIFCNSFSVIYWRGKKTTPQFHNHQSRNKLQKSSTPQSNCTGPISLSGASRHHHQAHTLIGHPELPHEEVVEFKGTLLRHIPHNVWNFLNFPAIGT